MINFNTIQMVASKNLPSIFSGMAMATSALAVVEGCSATVKAVRVLDKMHYESEKEPTLQEKVAAVAPLYARTGILLVMTEFEIFGAQRENDKRIAALTTLLSMKEKELQDTEDAVKTIFGEKKAKEVEKEVVRKDIESDPPNMDHVDDTGTGTTLFHDGTLGGYFLADIEFVKHAINEIDNRLNVSNKWNNDIVSGNDLMRALNRTHDVDVYDNLVWMPGDQLNARLYQDEWATASQNLYDTTERDVKQAVWTLKYKMPHEIFDRDE